ncbi:MAG: permease-like cell division protein FtsX [Desulfohalobiaceae bacterium]
MIFRLIIKGLKDLGQNKWEQLLTLAAVTLVIFLGGMFLLAMHNVQQYVIEHQGEISFEVYWEKAQNEEEVQTIHTQWQKLQDKDNLHRMDTYTPDQGLQVLQDKLAQDLDLGQEENPLPPTAILGFRLESSQPEEEAKQIYQELKGLPLVQEVKFNPLQLDLASSWTRLAKQVLWPFVIFLTLLVGLILGNTFKLAQMNRREEIEVLQLVGAANWYIQLPQLVGGAVQALLGTSLALALLRLTQNTLDSILNQAPLWLEVKFLSPAQVLTMLGVLCATGIISSWVAVHR